jgi:signal transduction histidine kinase
VEAGEKREDATETLGGAREEERRRWARELHDRTLQGLAAIRIELTLALESEGEEGREMIERAIQSLEQEVTALRALIAELRPDEDGFEPGAGGVGGAISSPPSD